MSSDTEFDILLDTKYSDLDILSLFCSFHYDAFILYFTSLDYICKYFNNIFLAFLIAMLMNTVTALIVKGSLLKHLVAVRPNRWEREKKTRTNWTKQ